MSYVSGRLYCGETALTASAVPLSASATNIREVLVQADPGNGTTVLLGTVLAQEIVLSPGQSITIPIISLSVVYAKMSSGTGVVNWLARD